MPNERFLLERQHFDSLILALQSSGYEVIGPTVQDGAIIYDHLESTKELPCGWTDVQSGGSYRLAKSTDQTLFGYSVAPQSWKRILFPPALRLWEAHRDGNGFKVFPPEPDLRKRALLGVRACEIKAIEIQDRVFINGPYADAAYRSFRENILIAAVQCNKAGDTCFCSSMGSGPRVTGGFDILLTEILESDKHYFIVEAGTDNGNQVLKNVPLQSAGAEKIEKMEHLLAETPQKMGRILDQTDIKELLYRNYEHPRWWEVARRCLACTNCTIVCPTCFCSNIEDVTDLSGQKAERWRRWDSCFTKDHSYIHGGCVRHSGTSRYRQWLIHKLAAWIDQFGVSGCVGCGRCITWCPVAIDITEEMSAIRATGDASGSLFGKKGE